MIDKFLEHFRAMPSVDIIENGTLFIILALALIMFFNSSSPLNKYFIPVACIFATLLRVAHWAHFGNEPEFMTPLVSMVANLLP